MTKQDEDEILSVPTSNPVVQCSPTLREAVEKTLAEGKPIEVKMSDTSRVAFDFAAQPTAEDVDAAIRAEMTRLKFAEAQLRETTVCDALLMYQHFHEACIKQIDRGGLGDEDYLAQYLEWRPPQVVPANRAIHQVHATWAMELRDVMVDAETEECVLRGVSSAVDLLRGMRLLAEYFPNEGGRRFFVVAHDTLSRALSARVHVAVSSEPKFGTMTAVRNTLFLWQTIVVRASQTVPESKILSLQSSEQAIAKKRVRMELRSRGMAELGALILSTAEEDR